MGWVGQSPRLQIDISLSTPLPSPTSHRLEELAFDKSLAHEEGAAAVLGCHSLRRRRA